jgi:hypothetical protein
MQRRSTETTSIRPEDEVQGLRREAQETPPGAERYLLILKARQAETAARMHDWIESPGLRPPE